MNKYRSLPVLFAMGVLPLILGFVLRLGKQESMRQKAQYELSFASFAPLNTDLFIADANGMNAKPLQSHETLDYNASFSKDGKWILFTSERNGSADIYRVHPDGSGLKQLTTHPAFDDQAAFSPDGKFIAFVSSRSGQADIFVEELSTQEIKNITNHPSGDFRPSWSPDGKMIAFSSDRDSKKPKGNGGFETAHSIEIYIVNSDGSNVQKITNADAVAGSPSWSSDGKRILFHQASVSEQNKITSPRKLRGTTQIASVDIHSKQISVLTSGEGEKLSPREYGNGFAYLTGGPDGGLEFLDGGIGQRGEFNNPSWSADGKKVVFHRETERHWPPTKKVPSLDPAFSLTRTGIFPSYHPFNKSLICNDNTAGILHNRIITMNVDGSSESVLFYDSVKSALVPVWSPQGEKIAFALGQFFQTVKGPAVADIAVINGDGSNLQILTNGKGNFGFPSWSPDGKQIVYRMSSDSTKGLFIIDVDTKKIKALTANSHDNFPVWSPTGEFIAFTSKRENDYDIYVIRPDGSDLKRVTTTPGNDAHNVWSPDGKWIAFSTSQGYFKDEAILHIANPQPYGEICVIRADGTDRKVLTDNQYEEATPGWRPLKR
jgi:TolB protein